MDPTCPICRKQLNSKENPYQPFCSERCKLIDLESWISERYRVQVDEESPEREDSPGEEESASSDGNQ